MNVEVIGIIASIIVLLSFLMRGEKKIRIINILGALMFVLYGITLKAFSVWFLNGILCIVHIYKLINLGKK